MVDYRDFDSDEREIAELFRDTWKINFSKVIPFKGVLFPYLFAKPDEDSSTFFNIQNEIMILFLRNDEFDERDLNVFDLTYQNNANRIDERILILISRDPKIKIQIEKLIQKRSHTRSLISYTYDELLESKKELGFQKKLNEIFYKKDLFSYELPINSEIGFFGRSEIIKEIISEHDLGKSIGLFGLRKLGKTSVLYSVGRHISARQRLSLYINFENPSLQQKKWFELLQHISDELRNEIFKKFDIEINEEDLCNYDEKNAAIEFKRDLEFYHSKIGNKILICFDEIERISPKTASESHWKNGKDTLFFWQTLRSIIQGNSNLLGLIIAGTNPLLFETPLIELADGEKVDNAVYRFISPKYLDFFDLNEMKKMIKSLGAYAGLNFEETVFTYLFDDFGGHPFLTRMACSGINKIVNEQTTRRPFTISRDFYRDNQTKIEIAVSDYTQMLIEVLKEWYPLEYSLFENLAIGNEIDFNKIVSEKPEIIQHLLGYKILKFSNGKYRFTIESVKNYLIRNSKLIPNNLDLNSKWAILGAERGNLERALRKFLREKSKLLHGKKKAAEKFIEIVVTPRKIEFAKFTIDEILSDDTKLPYFDELRLFVLKNWTDYEKVWIDKGRFDLYMNDVNHLRNDAHANSIKDDDLIKVIGYCRWLKNQIDSF